MIGGTFNGQMNEDKKSKHSSFKEVNSIIDVEEKKKILELITLKFSQKQHEITMGLSLQMAGGSGVGKSSLVNAVFGDPNRSEVGSSRPTTTESKAIRGFVTESERSITIHDCKGLETGVGETEKYLLQNSRYLSEKNVHIVWYVVGCGTNRFLNTDLELIHTLYRSYPVILVLNKVDQIGLLKIKDMIEVIREMIRSYEEDHHIVSNIKQIVKTSANIYDKDRRTVYMYKKCFKCGTERTLMDTFDKIGICRNKGCGHVQDIAIDDGLKNLVQETLKLLPDIVKTQFICEQQVDLVSKDHLARELLTQSFHSVRKDYKKAFNDDSIGLIVDLGRIFGMNSSGKKGAQAIYSWFSKDVIGDDKTSKFMFNVVDYFEKLFYKMTSIQTLVVLEGMFFYSFFRKTYCSNFQMDNVDTFDIDSNDASYERYYDMLTTHGFEVAMNLYFQELSTIKSI
jgi:GTPase Era involved in 16S rRNA processing